MKNLNLFNDIFIFNPEWFNLILNFFIIICLIGFVISVSLLLMSGRGQKIFDNIVKGLTGGAGASVIYDTIKKRNDKDKEKNKDKNKKNNNSNITKSYIFPFVLQYLNISIPPESESYIQFAFGVFLISLVCFFCVINILFYFFGIYLINKNDLINKWPKLKWFINIYKNTNWIFIMIEGIMCLGFLLFLIISSLIIIGIISI